jgi:hypothetical protein
MSKVTFGRITYTFIRTSGEKAAGPYKVYWRTGSRDADHKVANTSRVKALLLLL